MPIRAVGWLGILVGLLLVASPVIAVVPVPIFTCTPTAGVHPLTVGCDPSASTGIPTEYNLTWGEGEGFTLQATSDEMYHTYQVNGSYDVSLNVSNLDGFELLNKPYYISVFNIENEKISDFSFSILILLAFGLVLYGFKDSENPYYGNVLAHGAATVIFLLAALMILGGTVASVSVQVNQTVDNITVYGGNLTTFDYLPVATPIQDIALVYFLAFMGVTTGVFAGIMVVDSREEIREENEREKEAEEE